MSTFSSEKNINIKLFFINCGFYFTDPERLQVKIFNNFWLYMFFFIYLRSITVVFHFNAAFRVIRENINFGDTENIRSAPVCAGPRRSAPVNFEKFCKSKISISCKKIKPRGNLV